MLNITSVLFIIDTNANAKQHNHNHTKTYERRPLRVNCNYCKWASITQTGDTTMSASGPQDYKQSCSSSGYKNIKGRQRRGGSCCAGST